MYKFEEIENLESLELGEWVIIYDNNIDLDLNNCLEGRIIGLDLENKSLNLMIKKRINIDNNSNLLLDENNKKVKNSDIFKVSSLFLSQNNGKNSKTKRIFPHSIHGVNLLDYEEKYCIKNYNDKKILAKRLFSVQT